jgi:plasmid maintenance system antidote protein VapI
MYYFKEDVINIFNQSEIARQLGVAVETISRIFNRKQGCSKLMALCIVKVIHPEAEINEYFEIKKKGE